MKHNKLAILLASALSFLAVSCVEEIEQKPLYPTNTGEEFVDVTVESLDFQGRGGSLNFTVSASYDVTITADEWITMSSLSVPGDAREYVLTATVGANKGDGAADRTGHIYVSTRNLQKEITAARSLYNDTVNQWNTDVFSWPTKQIVAARAGYTTRIPFAASAATKAAARQNFFG